MKILEHEGKRYIEYNSASIVVITSIVCFAICFLVLVIFLIVKADSIYSDPFVYGAKAYNVTLCRCALNSTDYFYFDQKKVWLEQFANPQIKLIENT